MALTHSRCSPWELGAAVASPEQVWKQPSSRLWAEPDRTQVDQGSGLAILRVFKEGFGASQHLRARLTPAVPASTSLPHPTRVPCVLGGGSGRELHPWTL